MIGEDKIKEEQDKIPPLYAQDGSDDPTAYWHYRFELPLSIDTDSYKVRSVLGFHNLFTEYDRETGDGFGWGMIHGDVQNAELGYANVYELEKHGMTRDPLWEPCPLSIGKKKAIGYMEPKGSEDHYLWWSHFYKRALRVKYLDERLRNETVEDFSRRLYKRIIGA